MSIVYRYENMAEKLAKALVAALGGLTGLAYGKELIVFIISLLPILELRGGLIAASLLKMNPWESYLISIIGNLLPVPFILFVFDKIHNYMRVSKIRILKSMALWLDKKVEKHRKSIETVGFFGLVMFIGVPLPGTGAWTGCLIASAIGLDRKKSFLAAVLGVFIASIIMMIVSFGIIGNVVK